MVMEEAAEILLTEVLEERGRERNEGLVARFKNGINRGIEAITGRGFVEGQKTDLSKIVIVLDLDGTLRGLTENIKTLSPGDIDDMVIKYLRELAENWATLVLATRNPLEQHFLSGNKTLRKLKEADENIILMYSKKWVVWPFKSVKDDSEEIGRLAEEISNRVGKPRGMIAIGDAPKDKIMYEELATGIKRRTGGFPLYVHKLRSGLDKLPERVRNWLPT